MGECLVRNEKVGSSSLPGSTKNLTLASNCYILIFIVKVHYFTSHRKLNRLNHLEYALKKSLLIQSLLAAAAAVAVSTSAQAAVKPCDELKSEIAAKLDANHVKNYTLTVVAADQVGDAKVIGSCNGGTEKITIEKSANGAKK